MNYWTYLETLKEKNDTIALRMQALENQNLSLRLRNEYLKQQITAKFTSRKRFINNLKSTFK